MPTSETTTETGPKRSGGRPAGAETRRGAGPERPATRNGAASLKTPRTKLRRLPARGHHDLDTLHAILDAGLVCHVGFAHDGRPAVIPTLYARVGDHVYLHGSAASRMLRTLAGGADLCLTVTLIDGLVLARSAFHHSVNYRSAVLFGTAHPVEDPAERNRALHAFTERLIPGRWDHVRTPTRQELKATSVLVLPIEEGSSKVRSGPPLDDDEDYELDVWAGVVPLQTEILQPVPDARLTPGIAVPEHVARFVAQ